MELSARVVVPRPIPLTQALICLLPSCRVPLASLCLWPPSHQAAPTWSVTLPCLTSLSVGATPSLVFA